VADESRPVLAMLGRSDRRLSEALRLHVPGEVTPGPADLLGLELEFSVRSERGGRVDFGSPIHASGWTGPRSILAIRAHTGVPGAESSLPMVPRRRSPRRPSGRGPASPGRHLSGRRRPVYLHRPRTHPAITSADATAFTLGRAGTFTVTTTGSPTPSISETRALPSGVTFVDNGDRTATLSGTPGKGAGGIYSLTITAANGNLPGAA
jgi:hypothetical protein